MEIQQYALENPIELQRGGVIELSSPEATYKLTFINVANRSIYPGSEETAQHATFTIDMGDGTEGIEYFKTGDVITQYGDTPGEKYLLAKIGTITYESVELVPPSMVI